MTMVLEQLQVALSLQNLVFLLLATMAGILIGATPGLTVIMAVALAVPFAIHLPLAPALTLILCLYVSGIYGGSVSAILLNTPGTPAAAATVLDGYPLARRGQAGKALQMALWASLAGGLISIVVLMTTASALAHVSLLFGPTEKAALLIFALSVVSLLSEKSLIRGLLSASAGLLISTVGSDPLLLTNRFTLGIEGLEDGFGFVPVLVGLFAISEILLQAETRMQQGSIASETDASSLTLNDSLTWAEFRTSKRTIVRSSVIGVLAGILPGIGATVACFLGYSAAKRASKHPEEFGQGSLEGVAAAEAANNAVSGATLIPLLALSIPGDAVTAVLYSALLIQGVQTGPLIFEFHLDAVYLIYLTLILANLAMVLVAGLMLPILRRVTSVPSVILFPIVVVLCVFGSFAAENRTFDIFVATGFGLVGYLMNKAQLPLTPLLIAFILGRPLEESLRQSLVSARGDWSVFLTHPISAGFLLVTGLIVVLTIWRKFQKCCTEAAPTSSDPSSSTSIDS